MNRDYFYVTTPIYYVNDKPHIGHAYTTILADVLARYHRLAGIRTHFLTGTDEHGQKVKQAADKAGMTPREQADSTVVRFQEAWQRLEITNDDFIRTTEDRHVAVVQGILQDLYDRGEIYKADYDGWYDVASETFVTEKDLPEGQNPEDLPNITRITETNYFFRMSAYQEWLIQYINDNPEFIQPEMRRNETLGFLRKPLGDLCISRPKSRMSWGIELPFDKGFVTYVWFDALVNYISAIGYRADDERFNSLWPVSLHLIGKDILTTHTVYWPTMLKAMSLPMPKTVFAHGWWLTGKTKMSKSLGNVVNPMDCIERFGVDAFRYFLMSEMTLGQDASFTEEAFVLKYNADLANDLGNVLNRVMKLIQKDFDGKVPEALALTEAENDLQRAAIAAAEGMLQSVTAMRLDQGLQGLAAVIRRANQYLEQQQPWTLVKDPANRERVATVLYTVAELLRVVSGMLYPVMPGKMIDLRKALGLGSEPPQFDRLHHWGGLAAGTEISEMIQLFPRAQKPAADKEERKMEQTKPAEDKAADGLIDISEFGRVQLRTARIMTAEKIEGADKLLKLQIDLGGEQRQLVAGIAQHYQPEELPGRMVVVVANLKPAKIRGVESRGMLLAASHEGRLVLLGPDGDIPSGCPVK